jgi:hypothetical protein
MAQFYFHNGVIKVEQPREDGICFSPLVFYTSANGKQMKIASSTRRRSGSHVRHSRRAVVKAPGQRAFLGALPSRRRVENEMLRCKTRRRDASAPRLLCNSFPERLA